jgi:hypothetical protein
MILNFFIELWNRIKARSPKFFQVLQVFFGALTLLGYLPAALDRYFDVQLADHFVNLCKDIAKYTTGFFAATLLPVRNAPIGETATATITITEEKKLPYTVNHEKEIQDNGNKNNPGTS